MYPSPGAQAACSALCNVTPSAGVPTALASGPGLPLLLAALDTHRASAGVANAAMWALWGLSLAPDGRAALRASGAGAKVREVAALHPNSHTVQASASKCLVVLE